MTSWSCACGGAWIGVDRLVELAEDVRGELVTLPWASRDGAARACPACGEAMRTVSLAGVALDRCFAHGIWFDADELQQVLRHAESFPQQQAKRAAPPSQAPAVARAAPAAMSPWPTPNAPDPAIYDADLSSGSGSSGGGWALLGGLLELVVDIATDD